MDQHTRDSFDNHRDFILDEAARKFEFSPSGLTELGSFESYVFAFTRNGREYVLKLTHNSRRTKNLVAAELEWVNYLADGGVSVARAIPARSGALVERVDLDRDYFLIYAFEKAPGSHLRADGYTDELIGTWGKMIGRMHALTRHYRPSAPELVRYHWHEDPSLDAMRMAKGVDRGVLERFEEQISLLRSLPADESSYGLIHNDLHPGNFYVCDGTVTAFDFDDCHYNFLVNDIAMALFYSLRRRGQPPGDDAFAARYLSAFLDGYDGEYTLDPAWMRRIPEFMKMREIDLYLIIHAYGAVDGGPWITSFLDGRRERILSRRPVIDLDLSDFIDRRRQF